KAANVSEPIDPAGRSTAVPIVFVTGSDPVKDGLVASLNRPGGNITGVSFVSGALATKRFEILRQLTPNAKTIAMLGKSRPLPLTSGNQEALALLERQHGRD